MSGIDPDTLRQSEHHGDGERRAVKELGREKWDEITASIAVPADNMEERRLSHLMREFLRRYEAAVEPGVAERFYAGRPRPQGVGLYLGREVPSLQRHRCFCSAMRKERLPDSRAL